MSLNNISKWKYSNFLINKSYNFDRKRILKLIPSNLLLNSNKTISNWKNYKKTPLLKLEKLNRNLKLNNIFYKDESKRFHLKSFKALGGAYAVEKISKGKKNIIISSATAGNHGRSVAWGAQRLGLQCKIFVSQYVSETRVKEIEKFGADVIRVRGNYEDSLNECKKLSKKNNWIIVQDVSTKNYRHVPLLTMAGYSIMIKEIKFTDKALKQINVLLSKKDKGSFFRIAIKGGGCSGFQYEFTFDKEKNDDDLNYQNILIDKTSADLLKGSEVDYVSELIGEQFKITNPQTKSSCGCGVSFSL